MITRTTSRRQRLGIWSAGLAVTLAVATGCADTSGSASGAADEFPSDTFTIVVPYSPGGPSDLTMRALGDYLERETGQTVVVENRDGASGAAAMRYAMSQEADGYTLFNMGQGANIITPLLEDVDYDKDSMEPVANVAANPSGLVVAGDSPFKDAEALFDEARANPGDVSVATAGATTPGQIAVELLNTGSDPVPFKPVPFVGNTEALTALLGGNVDALQINLTDDVLARAESGDIRFVAVGTPERLNYLSDVPTYAELGFEDDIYSTSPFIVGVKEGTDPQIKEKLADLINGAVEDEQFIDTVGKLFVTDGKDSPEELDAFIDDTYAAYEPIIGGGR
jgi:tripartite-type tricarboxylate transporter receptor subunit TctC